MRRRTTRPLATALVVAWLAAACSGGGNEADTTGIAAMSTIATTTTAATTATTVVATTAAPPTAPPVPTTAVPTVPTATEQANPYRIRPEDEPIIAAYLEAIDAFHAAASAPELSAHRERMARAYETHSFEPTWRFLRAQHDAGLRLDVRQGVTPRAYVLERDPASTEAFLYDCQLDGAYWAYPDGRPEPGEATAVQPLGLLNRMVLEDGRWLLAEAGEDETACLAFSH